MLTNKQQAIVDSLVNEFTKMNQPTSSVKKGLLDWNEIYQEKDEWENTKIEINLKNEAFIQNARIEVERINEMLDDEFANLFYIHQPQNNNINYGWSWYIVPHGKHWHNALVNVNMKFINKHIYDKSNTAHVRRIDGLYFNSSASDEKYDSIEDLFSAQSVINKFRSYINSHMDNSVFINK
jgi:hypothetical protein